jgi:hypothetical protein
VNVLDGVVCPHCEQVNPPGCSSSPAPSQCVQRRVLRGAMVVKGCNG